MDAYKYRVETMAENENGLPPSSYFNIFRVSLTRDQQLALTALLPRAYSFQPYKCTRSLDEESLRSEPLKPAKSTLPPYAEKKELKDPDYLVPYPNKLKEAPTAKVDSTQAIPGGEPFLECYLILKRLKKSMYAWPFKTPVDPKALGIPEYLNVVQEPMDLKTMEDALRREGYAHPGEFHRDMYKMLMNSYKFNQKNSEVFSNTVEFQEEYLRLSKEAREGKLLAAEKKKAEGTPEEETPTLSKEKPQSSVQQKPPRQYNKKPKPDKQPPEDRIKVQEGDRGRVKVEQPQKPQVHHLPSFSQLFDDFNKAKQEELVDFSEIYQPKEKPPMREEIEHSVSNDAHRSSKQKDGRGRGERKPKEKQKTEITESLKEIKELKEVTQVQNEKNVVLFNIQRRLSDLLRKLNEFQFNKPKQRPLAKPEADHPNFNNFTNITTSQKKKLAERISLLPPTELKYVLEICCRNRPRSRDEEVFEIDLEKTDPKTLKELSNFVAMRTKHAKRGPKTKSESSKAPASQMAVQEPYEEERYEMEAEEGEGDGYGENQQRMMEDRQREQQGDRDEQQEEDSQQLDELVLQHPQDDIHSRMLQEQNFNFSVAELLEIDDNGRNSDEYRPDEDNYHF